MNLFFLKYDFDDEMTNNIYSWQEILFALNNKIITNEDVIQYAIYIISPNITGFDIVLEITGLHSYDDTYPYLCQLISLEDTQDIADIKEKWLYYILKWLYKKRSYIQNVFDVIEELYELFGRPDIMKPFVRYLPSDIGDLGSITLNQERLIRNWDNYLKEFRENHLVI